MASIDIVFLDINPFSILFLIIYPLKIMYWYTILFFIALSFWCLNGARTFLNSSEVIFSGLLFLVGTASAIEYFSIYIASDVIFLHAFFLPNLRTFYSMFWEVLPKDMASSVMNYLCGGYISFFYIFFYMTDLYLVFSLFYHGDYPDHLRKLNFLGIVLPL